MALFIAIESWSGRYESDGFGTSYHEIEAASMQDAVLAAEKLWRDGYPTTTEMRVYEVVSHEFDEVDQEAQWARIKVKDDAMRAEIDAAIAKRQAEIGRLHDEVSALRMGRP